MTTKKKGKTVKVQAELEFDDPQFTKIALAMAQLRDMPVGRLYARMIQSMISSYAAREGGEAEWIESKLGGIPKRCIYCP